MKKYYLLALALPSLLTSCMSGSSQRSSQTGNINSQNNLSAVKVNNLSKVQDNDVSFGNNIVPYNDNIFTEISHSIGDDEYDGIQQLPPNGIRVRAGRTGTSIPAIWLVDNGYAIYYDTDLKYPFAGSTNFAVIGDLTFYYTPNAQPYKCSTVGLVQVGLGLGNVWGVISNIEPRFCTLLSTGLHSPQDISCINQLTSKEQKFTVSRPDGNGKFNISIKKDDGSPNVFSEVQFGDVLTKAFNSIPTSNAKNQIFSNGIYNVGGANKFVIYNPREFNFTKVSESSEQTDIQATGNTELWTDVSELPNNTPINQTFPTTTHSLTVTNSVTTRTTDTIGGQITVGVSAGFLNIFNGKTSYTVKYDHTWGKESTTTTSEQYATPATPILIPPYCKAIITQRLSQSTYKGAYKFNIGMTGLAKVDGMAFWGSGSPSSYKDGTAGIIDLYTTFSQSTYTDPRVIINPSNKTINFLGAGEFIGQFGTLYTLDVTFTRLREHANCHHPFSIQLYN